MCDKNYNHCKNQNVDCESDLSNESNDKDLKKKRPKKKNLSNSIEEESYNLHVLEQPHSLYPPSPSHAKLQFDPSNNPNSSKKQFIPSVPFNPAYSYNPNAQITLDPAHFYNPNAKITPDPFARNQNTRGVSFTDQQPILQFSPSFNIASNKKSTPVQQKIKSEQFSQTAVSLPTQNQTVVTIEPTPNLHPDTIESDETLC